MANEAMTAIELWEWLVDKSDDGMSDAELIDRIEQFAQARAETAEEAGYRRGIEAAAGIVEARHQSSCNDRVIGASWEMLEQIRALLLPDTQETKDA